MISYTLYQKNPASHYLYIDLLIGDIRADQLLLQLPAWRPGRYELGNFAKNIKHLQAFGDGEKELPYQKLSKDLWQINTKGFDRVKITYSYFAAELNAGSCYASPEQVYVNPVHCCLYVPDRMNEQHVIELRLPDDYKVACALPIAGKKLTAASFDELADSPFIASPTLQTRSYQVKGHTFFLHFQGECRPDFDRIVRDFTLFTNTQLNFWEELPVKDYHFLFQIAPVRTYHGVEHQASTVIALGPGYAINTGSTYEDLLGVSSHELFHTWNVKAIRPAEMQPYDFTRENYARTGYVYEGFTTYYGDKMLLASGAFTPDQYFVTLQERLQRHFHNFGRFNLSVAQSSWETWLDGYVPGAPYRKTSIYDEGCLVAFMLDTLILRASGNKRSLRDVCRNMYRRFGRTGEGYTEHDMVALAGEAAGTDLRQFFDEVVYAPADYTQRLQDCCAYLGMRLSMKPAAALSERLFGFKTAEGPPTRITLVAPYSPAWKAGLFAGDEIVAVNGMAVRGNLNHWLGYFGEKGPINLSYVSDERLKTCKLPAARKGQTWFDVPDIGMAEAPTPQQTDAFTAWLGS